jgi:hypothetical protein
MKKIIAALAAFILLQNTIAQNKLAVKGGYNYSTARAYFDGKKQTTGFKSGYGLGLLFKTNIEGILHFSPGLTINKRGYTIEPSTGPVKKYDNDITYIDLYPGLSLDIPMKKDNFFILDVGPQFGFTNFGNEKTTDAMGAVTSAKMQFSLSGSYGIADVGMNGGIGVSVNKFLVELKYYHGLSSINNEEEFDKRNIRNRMISFCVGYFFK